MWVRDHPYVTSAKGLGGFKKLQFLDNDQYCIYADCSEWVVQKRCADVIYGWFFRDISPNSFPRTVIKT